MVLLLTLLFGALLGICGFWLLDRILPNFIAFDCPTNADRVTTLRGQIIDSNWRVYILIKPRLASNLFAYSASPPDKDGVWYATCHFGGKSGEFFEVRAVALPPDSLTVDKPTPTPQPEWLDANARFKTTTCVVRQE
jgi:hypothetical protein